MEITFNNQEWIPGQDFRYHDHDIERVAFAHNAMDTAIEEEEREKEWEGEVAEEELPEEITEEEIAKLNEQKQLNAEAETEEATTMAKRKGYRLFLYGKNFLKSEQMIAKFSFGDQININAPVIYKNACLLGTTIPDFGPEVPEGDHMMKITVSLNGQQYSTSAGEFLYKSVDPNLTEEDLKKLDEEDAKNRLKAPPKKK